MDRSLLTRFRFSHGTSVRLVVVVDIVVVVGIVGEIGFLFNNNVEPFNYFERTFICGTRTAILS